MRELGLAGEASPFGRWIRIWGVHGPVYVAKAAFGRGYYTWDDAAHRRCVGPYDDAREAIRAGLWRAEQAQVERAAAQRRDLSQGPGSFRFQRCIQALLCRRRGCGFRPGTGSTLPRSRPYLGIRAAIPRVY